MMSDDLFECIAQIEERQREHRSSYWMHWEEIEEVKHRMRCLAIRVGSAANHPPKYAVGTDRRNTGE